MRWGKQKKILIDHPYFDGNSDAILSRKESERIYNSGFPTFEEMIEGAKERFDIPVDAWQSFNEVIQSRVAKHRNRTGISFFLARRRFAVAMMIVILIISFFTLIPFGRALAADFYNMIMRVIDGRIEISSENPDYDKYEYFNFVAEQYNEGDSDLIEQNAPISYPNIKEFVMQTGHTPITINTDWLKCQTIQSYRDEEQSLTLTIQYMTSDGALVAVTQQWGGVEVAVEVQNASYKKVKILDNIDLLYTKDSVDGSFNGTAVLSDSLLFVGAEKDVNIEKLLKALE